MSSLANNIGLSIFTFLSRIVSGSIVYIILARLMSVNDFVDAYNSKKLINLITQI
jgi:peptidoglycan biosynthesis protein MviN/MurJ (putative lipid II flippase)